MVFRWIKKLVFVTLVFLLRSVIGQDVGSSNETTTIFEEHFEIRDSLGQFSQVTVSGSPSWSWVSWDSGATGAVQANGYHNGGPSENWLITSHPMSFDFYTHPQLTYDAQQSFAGPHPKILFSSTYEPSSDMEPSTADWTLIFNDTSSFENLTAVGPIDLSGIATTKGYIAFVYRSDGSNSGESVRYTIDDIVVEGVCGYNFDGKPGSNVADNPGPWQVFNINSAYGWQYSEKDGHIGAYNGNYGSPEGGTMGGTSADDYLVSPSFAINGEHPVFFSFMYYEQYTDDATSSPLEILVTANWTGDPNTTEWHDITPETLDGSTSGAYIQASSDLIPIQGDDLRMAFRYISSGNSKGTTKNIAVDMPCLKVVSGPLANSFSFSQIGGEATLFPTVTGGTPPYGYLWDLGNGRNSTETAPVVVYTEPGKYSITLTVVDADGTSVQSSQTVNVTTIDDVPPKAAEYRFATFNTAFSDAVNRQEGVLAEKLVTSDFRPAQLVADIVQRVNPDILFLNEFDHVWTNGVWNKTATEQMIHNFRSNYLEVPQAQNNSAVKFDYFFVAPCNTGVPSGFDLDNNGEITLGNDAYGYGDFPGAFSMIFLSKFPVVEHSVRTFQHFLWKDMTGALLPPDPLDSNGDGNTESYYSAEELDVFRLSSKSHWDISVDFGNEDIVHFLVAHPTPPVFDDGTAVDAYPSTQFIDWNGLRNHDEIKFWADYITPVKGNYIYDDNEWKAAGETTPNSTKGGLPECDRFVILGDQNADPVDGDGTYDPILSLLNNDLIDTSITPTSEGGLEFVPKSFHDRETKTATFNLRSDYALPSVQGLQITQALIFWPESTDLEAYLNSVSDHRLVAIDVNVIPVTGGSCAITEETTAPASQSDNTTAPGKTQPPVQPAQPGGFAQSSTVSANTFGAGLILTLSCAIFVFV